MEANTKPGANPHQKKGRADFAMQQVGAVIPLLARRSSDIYPVQSPNKKRLLGREIERSKDIDPDLKLRMATVILGNFDLLYPAVVPELGESMHAWKTILIFGCRKGRRKTSEEATSTRVITENILITEKQTIGNMETRSLVSTIALQLYKKVLKHSVEIFI
mmetsp:Transcript_80718/g.216359  ORF Transcript_80718/g.216359 Transcript_80718/m.216359 type:complete len:162 (+) Transcript_80718:115-600(+)